MQIYIYPRNTQSMVDFETRVFAGTPVTFAKIPGDSVKFVPLQYSLMPFPVRPFVFFLIKVDEETTLFCVMFVETSERKTENVLRSKASSRLVFARSLGKIERRGVFLV